MGMCVHTFVAVHVVASPFRAARQVRGAPPPLPSHRIVHSSATCSCCAPRAAAHAGPVVYRLRQGAYACMGRQYSLHHHHACPLTKQQQQQQHAHTHCSGLEGACTRTCRCRCPCVAPIHTGRHAGGAPGCIPGRQVAPQTAYLAYLAPKDQLHLQQQDCAVALCCVLTHPMRHAHAMPPLPALSREGVY